MTTKIRAGMGGWSYEPWRETFYPPEVKAKGELEFASRQVTAIEINSTFYRLQKPDVFAKWRDSTPANFVFSLKAPRFVTQRKALAEGVEGAKRFVDSGISKLEGKLGPIVWQLTPEHRFELEDLAAFLESLPKSVDGVKLRHALNVRHESFRVKQFVELARSLNVAIVYEHDASHPAIADVTADFVYARLRRSVSTEATGYPLHELEKWAARAQTWAAGKGPADLPLTDGVSRAEERKRDVFIYFINGAKERAPAAAIALIKLLD